MGDVGRNFLSTEARLLVRLECARLEDDEEEERELRCPGLPCYLIVKNGQGSFSGLDRIS